MPPLASDRYRPGAHAVVVMGVSGSGKTAVGGALAQALGWAFFDGDDFHPESNRRKMASGVPLEDADRWPWLDRLRTLLDEREGQGLGTVLACSALRRAYREHLGVPASGRLLVFLDGDRDVLEARLGARTGHFMPASLLDSQIATLERPEPDGVIRVDVAGPLEGVIARALAAVRRALPAA
jgi:gluconokinase